MALKQCCSRPLLQQPAATRFANGKLLQRRLICAAAAAAAFSPRVAKGLMQKAHLARQSLFTEMHKTQRESPRQQRQQRQLHRPLFRAGGEAPEQSYFGVSQRQTPPNEVIPAGHPRARSPLSRTRVLVCCCCYCCTSASEAIANLLWSRNEMRI